MCTSRSRLGAAASLPSSSGRGQRRVADRPVEHAGGDQSIYVEDPEGNVVEVGDYSRTATAGSRESRGLEP